MAIKVGRSSKPKAEPQPGGESGVASPLRFLWLIGPILRRLPAHCRPEQAVLRPDRRTGSTERQRTGTTVYRRGNHAQHSGHRDGCLSDGGDRRPLGPEKAEGDLLKKVAKLEHDLAVLKDGGVVRQLIYLNVEGMDKMVREVASSRTRETQDT